MSFSTKISLSLLLFASPRTQNPTSQTRNPFFTPSQAHTPDLPILYVTDPHIVCIDIGEQQVASTSSPFTTTTTFVIKRAGNNNKININFCWFSKNYTETQNLVFRGGTSSAEQKFSFYSVYFGYVSSVYSVYTCVSVSVRVLKRTTTRDSLQLW